MLQQTTIRIEVIEDDHMTNDLSHLNLSSILIVDLVTIIYILLSISIYKAIFDLNILSFLKKIFAHLLVL